MSATKRQPLRPPGAPKLGETYRDWHDFTDRVARPWCDNDGEDPRIDNWYRTLMLERDPWYLAVALVMALNRIREDGRMIASVVDLNAAEMIGAIADRMRWDQQSQQIVIDVDNRRDETFPDDPDLESGPLLFAVWSMALRELADCLPPWDDPSEVSLDESVVEAHRD